MKLKLTKITNFDIIQFNHNQHDKKVKEYESIEIRHSLKNYSFTKYPIPCYHYKSN